MLISILIMFRISICNAIFIIYLYSAKRSAIYIYIYIYIYIRVRDSVLLYLKFIGPGILWHYLCITIAWNIYNFAKTFYTETNFLLSMLNRFISSQSNEIFHHSFSKIHYFIIFTKLTESMLIIATYLYIFII